MTPALASGPASGVDPAERRRAAVCVALALALHAVALYAVRLAPAVPRAAPSATAVEVSLVAPAAPSPPADRPPRPVAPRPVAPPPVPEPAPKPAPRAPVAARPAPAPTVPEASAPPEDGLAGSEAEVAPGSAPSPVVALPAPRERVAAVPRYRHNPEPRYPATARRRGQEGLVLLAVRVSAAGAVERVAVKTGSGTPTLDAAAVEAVEQWRFDPALEDGEPVAAEVEVPIRFALD